MIDGLFDVEFAFRSLDRKGDILYRLNAEIDWEEFRPLLSQVRKKERKNSSGHKPFASSANLRFELREPSVLALSGTTEDAWPGGKAVRGFRPSAGRQGVRGTEGFDHRREYR